VHISELAQHHVENPRELIRPGDPVRVKILEIDSERRRLSLSIKRVEGQVLPVRAREDEGAVALDDVPELGLSEDVFAAEAAEPDPTPVGEPAAPADESAPLSAEAGPEAPAQPESVAQPEADVGPEAPAEPETEAQPGDEVQLQPEDVPPATESASSPEST
jgi:small subunit ribosomal protein S1